ncbi:hypothetical protein OG533_25395 [Streptomyces sp. NBC_01186]|nr:MULTISPECIES: hypothetical protein [unclassified Streptomyces]WSB76870.1 hypothetical protein OHB04_14550 [Streptomyces sp. NBC_01775]WSS14856.1 hypothetical protein OG533_25395 [Streptomyces sp. NBC_01186]WSS43691.1 hypothetical protein OG220_26160 [Streptomyces sp. NBC_01187]
MNVSPGSGDPVRGLMHQHRELCERAIDPLEIAAGLEARGITDRTAARFKHRDVFSLAEELYARIPRPETGSRVSGPATEGAGGQRDLGGSCTSSGARDAREAKSTGERRLFARPALVAFPLLPGLLCAATYVCLISLKGQPLSVRAGVSALGAVAVVAGALPALRTAILRQPVAGAAGPQQGAARTGPGSGSASESVRPVPGAAEDASSAGATGSGQGAREEDLARPKPRAPFPLPKRLALWACWLIAYALYGDWLVAELLGGGPDFPSALPGVPSPGAACGLTLAVAPAVWCARGFALGARLRLTGSRSLEEFAAGVRPLLAAALVLFTGCFLALQWAAHALADGKLAASGAPEDPSGSRGLGLTALLGVTSLGVLLFTALLLAAHGFRTAACAGLAGACVIEAVTLLTVLAARLPGLAASARPLEAAVALQGTPVVQLAACGVAALALLGYAARALTGASAHHQGAAPA